MVEGTQSNQLALGIYVAFFGLLFSSVAQTLRQHGVLQTIERAEDNQAVHFGNECHDEAIEQPKRKSPPKTTSASIGLGALDGVAASTDVVTYVPKGRKRA